MKGVEPHPLLGAFAPKGADKLRDKRYCCIFILRRSCGISPGRQSKISPELQFIAYCRVFPPRGRRFPRSPRPFDCCIALGVIYGGCIGSFWLRRAATGASKMRINSESAAGSFLLCGRPRRGPSEAGRETLTTYEGGAAAAGPLAAGGGQRRRSDDGCT